jgi:hypothetical protein
MIYFLVLSVVVAVTGLFGASVAQETAFAVFSYALFLFGVGFGFFTVRRHFDLKDGKVRP